MRAFSVRGLMSVLMVCGIMYGRAFSEHVPSKYTLYSVESLKIHTNGGIENSGLVGSGDNVTLGIGATVNGSLIAKGDVLLSAGATVNGDVASGGSVSALPLIGARITGTIEQHAQVPEYSIPVRNIEPGSQDIIVPFGGKTTLSPGKYDLIEVLSWGTLTLTSGVYEVNKFILNFDSKLVLDFPEGGGIAVNASEKILIRGRHRMFLSSSENPAAVSFYSDGTSDIIIGIGGRVYGTFIAPHAEIALLAGTDFTGALYGKKIDVYPEITFNSDTIAPLVQLITPEPSININSQTPNVTVNFSDDNSGIDTSTFFLAINGVNHTSQFLVTQSDASWQVPQDMQLSEGSITVEMTVSDRAGNMVREEAVFTIDVTDPLVIISEPADGFITNQTPVDVSWSVDGSVQTEQITQTLTEGANTIVRTAIDAAGNTATASITVTLDTEPPTVMIESPENNSAIKYPEQNIVIKHFDTISGCNNQSFVVTLNETDITDKFTTDDQHSIWNIDESDALSEGTYELIASITDNGGNTSTDTAVFIIDLTSPVISNILPTTGSVLNISQPTISGSFSDNLSGINLSSFELSINGSSVNDNIQITDEGFSYTPATELPLGDYLVSVTISDFAGNVSQTGNSFRIFTQTLPPDPVTVASVLDNKKVTDFMSATEFLYTGDEPIQKDVNPETIEPKRTSVLRGCVLTQSGEPLSGVTVSINGHPEFGYTLSREDGKYDLAVNGGGNLVVKCERDQYFDAQRQIKTEWQRFVNVTDIIMLLPDVNVTPISLTDNTNVQVARGSVTSDDRGERQATLFFPAGIQTTNLNTDMLNVRATEYTVGENGENAMPAHLPPGVGYTYCVELSVDGAEDVYFNKPVHLYLENFLHFTIGSAVPSGYYDKNRGIWVPSKNGKVIKVLSVENNLASVDVDGSGIAADDQVLADLNFNNDELTELAALYRPGQSLWRVPIPHFSPWDFNFPYGPPPDAEFPAFPDPKNEDEENICYESGSIIEVQNQILGQKVNLTGTPYSLHYSSGRVPGRKSDYILEIPITDENPPASLAGVKTVINVAGKEHLWATNNIFPSNKMLFTWDGYDCYNRKVQGRVPVTIKTGYVYNSAVYQTPAEFEQSFSSLSGEIDVNADRTTITLWQSNSSTVGNFVSAREEFGGWTLDIQHFYNPTTRVLEYGDGSRRNRNATNRIINTFAGTGIFTGTYGIYEGEGGPALDAQIETGDLVVGGDGSVYFVSHPCRICKIDRHGIITTIAGSGMSGFSGDGGPATEALFGGISAIDIDAKGNIYVADALNKRIRKIDDNGIVTTIAGTGGTDAYWEEGFDGDGGLATETPINDLSELLKVGPDGNVYYWEYGTRRLKRIGNDGIVTTVGGGCELSNWDYYVREEGVPARTTPIGSMRDMAIARDGTIYFTDFQKFSIRKIGTDGIVTTIAGTGSPVYSEDGGLTAETSLGYLNGIVIDKNGYLYFSDETSESNRIRCISPDGIITTVAGRSPDDEDLDGYGIGGPPAKFRFNEQITDIDIGPDGVLYIANRYSIYTLNPAFPGFSKDDITIASEDGNEIYDFNADGRHLKTVDALTGHRVYDFIYNEDDFLAAVIDRDSNVTTIERDSDNKPLSITAPYGQKTNLILNSDTLLTEIVNPVGDKIICTYSDGGLMESFTDNNGNTTQFFYDESGYLIKEENPAGGSIELTRESTELGTKITKTESVDENTSYETTYLTEILPTGEKRQVTKGCCGGAVEVITGTDGCKTKTSPDGTITTTCFGPDPRFRMQVPILRKQVVETPSGLKKEIHANRTALPITRSNLYEVDTLIDSMIVNIMVFSTITDVVNKKVIHTSPEGRSDTISLDSLGHITATQTTGELPVRYSYDERWRLTTIAQGEGADIRENSIEYNSDGYIERVVNSLGQSTSYEYDLLGRMVRSTSAWGRQTAYSYDKNGNITGLLPPEKPEHAFSYTTIDLIDTYSPPVVNAGENTTRYSYNLNKQLTGITLPDGLDIGFLYDELGRIQEVALPEEQSITYEYQDSANNLVGISNSAVRLGWEYDGALPTRSSMTGAVNGSIDYSYISEFYNIDLVVTSFRINEGDQIDLRYDFDGLPIQIGNMSIGYSSTAKLVATSIGTIKDSCQYNERGELTDYTALHNGAGIFSIAYTDIDKLGRITGVTETVEGATRTKGYSYDAEGQLTDVYENGIPYMHYEYDAVGNRISCSGNTGSFTGTYDAQDRMLTYGNNVYQYTANGELESKTNGSGTTLYNYDVLGNLTMVTLPDGTVIEYIIDGRNRRVGKKINGTLVQGFLYKDQINPVAELDGAGNVVATFIYGTRINVPDYMVKSGINYRIISDHLGSPRMVVDAETGAIAQRMDFDAFGNVLTNSNPGFQPFGFAGGLYDEHTGLVRFGARDYDPETGRWTCKDPIGFKGGDENLFRYVGNDPQTYIDPFGLKCKKTYSERVFDNFIETNKAIPGITIPSYLIVSSGWATAGITANAVGGITLGRWIFSGFKGVTLATGTYSSLGAGGIALGVTITNFLATSMAFETGIAIGSFISAAIWPCEEERDICEK